MSRPQKIKTNRNNCPIHLTNNVLGDKWILLILREFFLGYTKFDEFEKNLNISKSVLSVKLKMLLGNDLIKKIEYREEKKRPRNEYKLSPKGKQLIFIMAAILQWGASNLVNPKEEFLKLVDQSGNPVKMAFLDKNGEQLSLGDLTFELS